MNIGLLFFKRAKINLVYNLLINNIFNFFYLRKIK
jgi:hypothetical protein